ncbi:MAG: hypothetical protein WDO19_30585 [Bacteroidota bacterium]
MTNKKTGNNNQSGGITDKKDVNAGSGAFNQGSEQDPTMIRGRKFLTRKKKLDIHLRWVKVKRTQRKEIRQK